MQTTLQRRLNNLQYMRAKRAKETDPERQAKMEWFEKVMLALAKESMKEQDPSGPKM